MRDKSEHIAVLDGVRAYAILIVMGFHLWQQSWLQKPDPARSAAAVRRAGFSA